MAVRHSKEEIAAFLDGETRLIAAAYRDPERAGDVFVMRDGAADSVREFTRRDLRCMFPGCPTPRLRAVSRSMARDGFAHDAGGGHAPESLNHLQGKAVVADWLRRNLDPSAVKVEHAADTQRHRIPDILVTLPGGRQVAFEVQYASLTVAEWRDRHGWYAERGIQDVWLWGHSRLKLERSKRPRGFALDAVQAATTEAGMPVTFLNPNSGEIALAVASSHQTGSLRFPVAQWQTLGVVVEPIERYRITEDAPLWSLLIGSIRTAEANDRTREESERRAAQAAAHRWEARKRERERAQREAEARAAAGRAAVTDAVRSKLDGNDERQARLATLRERHGHRLSNSAEGAAPDQPFAEIFSRPARVRITYPSPPPPAQCVLCDGPLESLLATVTDRHVGSCVPRRGRR